MFSSSTTGDQPHGGFLKWNALGRHVHRLLRWDNRIARAVLQEERRRTGPNVGRRIRGPDTLRDLRDLGPRQQGLGCLGSAVSLTFRRRHAGGLQLFVHREEVHGRVPGDDGLHVRRLLCIAQRQVVELRDPGRGAQHQGQVASGRASPSSDPSAVQLVFGGMRSDPADGGFDILHQRRKDRLAAATVVPPHHRIAPLQSLEHWQDLQVGLVAPHECPAVQRDDHWERAVAFVREIDIELLGRRSVGVGDVQPLAPDPSRVDPRRLKLNGVVHAHSVVRNAPALRVGCAAARARDA